MLFILIVRFIRATVLKKVREHPYNHVFYSYDTLIDAKSTGNFLAVKSYTEYSETPESFRDRQNLPRLRCCPPLPAGHVAVLQGTFSLRTDISAVGSPVQGK